MRALAVFVAAATVVVVVACNSITVDNVAETVSRVSGDSQTVYVGKQRTAPLVVVVRRADGSPFAGAGVNWSISAGGGSLDSAVLTTGADGISRATYTSSDTAGKATIRVVAGKGSAEFTVTKLADTVGVLSALSGNGTATLVGAPVKLIAKAGDKFGNPIPNVVVNWTAPSGTLANATSTTDTTGRASTSITLGPNPGSYVVRAASKFNTVTFTLSAVPTPTP